MDPKTELSIDLKMLVEYRAKPLGAWKQKAETGDDFYARPYQSDVQRLWVELDARTKRFAVYSHHATHAA